jgi:hypothetical protein
MKTQSTVLSPSINTALRTAALLFLCLFCLGAATQVQAQDFDKNLKAGQKPGTTSNVDVYGTEVKQRSHSPSASEEFDDHQSTITQKSDDTANPFALTQKSDIGLLLRTLENLQNFPAAEMPSHIREVHKNIRRCLEPSVIIQTITKQESQHLFVGVLSETPYWKDVRILTLSAHGLYLDSIGATENKATIEPEGLLETRTAGYPPTPIKGYQVAVSSIAEHLKKAGWTMSIEPFAERVGFTDVRKNEQQKDPEIKPKALYRSFLVTRDTAANGASDATSQSFPGLPAGVTAGQSNQYGGKTGKTERK